MVARFEARIADLERRLLAYENAHTPPSKNGRRYPKREPTGNPVGAPKGPDSEPTNNRAERALREMVVQRKIIGTLRNERGTHMTEILMTCIQTWKLQGLNPFSMLRQVLSS